MNTDAFGTVRTRFYVPFILAFMVFSAVLATEHFVAENLSEEAYQTQTEQYHAIMAQIIKEVNRYEGEHENTEVSTSDFLDSLVQSQGIHSLKAQIIYDIAQYDQYLRTSFQLENYDADLDYENRVIETAAAKTANGEVITVYVNEHNSKLIKNLRDSTKGLIIISMLMIIIAIVPGALMIESITRRRRTAGLLPRADRSNTEEAIMAAVEESGTVACMVVSQGGKVLTANALCRKLLEISDKGSSFSLSSVTALPDVLRKGDWAVADVPGKRIINVNSMTGSPRDVLMENHSFTGEGGVVLSVLTFILLRGSEEGLPGVAENWSETASGELRSSAGIHILDSIIHDMNNHLSGIIGVASLEVGRSSRGGQYQSCEAILEAAEKLTSLCGDLKAVVSGREDPVLKDPSEEMNLIAEIMRRILPEDIHFSVSGSCQKMISVKRELLRDFIYNLSLNSTELISGGGRIRVNVSEKVPAGISSMESFSPGNTVCIRYSDGFIMPVALRDVLSNRQYSVADVERQFGTTIGALYRVCREMAGNIAFERGSGETILCLLLEGYEKPSQETLQKENPGEGASVAGLSVLVADEVAIVLNSTCEYLEHRGMATTRVSDGNSVMELLKRKKFDAAVLDLNMPGTPTPTIVRYCQTRLPGMAVVITTGYGITPAVQELIKFPSTDCVNKPHRPDVLVDIIYSALMRIHEGEAT